MTNTPTVINVLHSNRFTPNENAFLAPLHRFAKLLSNHKIQMNFYQTINDKLFDADILFLSSKFFGSWWREYGFERIQAFLIRSQQASCRVFWFDLSDSTGTTHFKVLPYVDRYIKGQILKDKTAYQQTYYGMRIATDFYHRQFNIDDEIPDEPHLNFFPADESLKKIQVGWNSGLCYYGRWRHQLEKLAWRQSQIYKLLKPRFYPPNKKRNRLCSGRFGCTYHRNTVSLPRRRIKEKLASTIAMEKVSMPHYFREMRASYSCLSPFGLGEISLRDFEIVLSGATMIKQNMDHLETWPNLWQKDETYLDFAWDFSDLEEKIAYAKENPEEMRRLATNAQQRYQKALLKSEDTGSFTEHLLNIIKAN